MRIFLLLLMSSFHLFGYDFEHPKYEDQSSSYKVIKSDSVWKAITKIILRDSIFTLKPEYGLSYNFKIQKSSTSISNIHRFKMNFIGREIKTEYPLLYKAIKSNNLDSLIWLPEALTVIIDKALSDLENNQKFNLYNIDRPRLVNHFKNSFSKEGWDFPDANTSLIVDFFKLTN